jgi:cobaltochelatase CobN
VDVLFTVSGIYRDGFPDKILLLDRASRLAASAGDNAISRHTRQAADALKRAGVDTRLAEQAAQARAFAAAPGEYGAGISKMVKQSRNNGVASAYLHHMGHVYSAALWGLAVPKALETHLSGNQAVVHSRSSNVYGVLDNDDFYDYAGGLNLASKQLNGSAPDFYVKNMRSRGGERTEDMRTFLATELNARYWNPKWIRRMQQAGYSGAREIADNLENLYGFQATASDHVDGSFWQNTYDVYVEDKHGLGMDEFFDKENPHARQYLLARLLEVDRQGLHRFSKDQRARLVSNYVASVSAHGASCSANTCGNLALYRHVRTQAQLVAGLGNIEMRRFTGRFSQSIRPPAGPSHSPAIVSGYRLTETGTERSIPKSTTGSSWPAYAAMLLLLAAGAARECFGRPRSS